MKSWDIYSEDFYCLAHIYADTPEYAVITYIEDDMLLDDIADYEYSGMTFFVAEEGEKELCEVKASANVRVEVDWADVTDIEDCSYSPEYHERAEEAGLILPNKPKTTSDVPKEQLHFDFFEIKSE